MCYNAVDRHVGNGRGDQAAVIYDSPVTGTKQVITYREVQEQVKLIMRHISNIWQAKNVFFVNSVAMYEGTVSVGQNSRPRPT